MREQNNTGGAAKGFILGVLAGGIAGSVTALLYAPKSGRELRKDIGQKKDKLVSDVDRYYEDTKKRLDVMIDEGKRKAENIIKDARVKAETLGSNAGSLYNQGMDFVSDEAAKLKGAVKAGIDAYKEERSTHTKSGK